MRLWGTIVLLVSAILILLIFSERITFNKWYVFLFFGFIIIVAISIVLDFIMPDKSVSYKKLNQIDTLISGTWGEFMHNHPYISLSVVKIKFNANRVQYILEGEAYNKLGENVANWSSDAAAVTQFDTPEIYYFWSGKVTKPKVVNKSGIGVLKFSSPEKNKPCSKATGSYTSENIEQLIISGKYDIDLLRFTSEDEKKLTLPKEELRKFIAEKMEEWKK
jgi:hypothetical protein